MKPTICFATVCKNESHIIRTVLESVYKYISYWVICDTGSTDGTQEIIANFFKEKNIPGELFTDEWIGFGTNKTLMMERAKNKADYILHFDADDILVGNFNFTAEDAGWDAYLFRIRRGTLDYTSTLLYKADYLWKFCGVAHTTVKCIDKPNHTTGDFTLADCYLASEDVGARSFDPEKYFRDAEKLKQQFFDTLEDDPDNLNSRSAFYAAQSYFDAGKLVEALQWNKLYTQLKNTWIEEEFEANLRIARCMIGLNKPSNEVITQIKKAIAIYPDRSESYFYLGRYLNVIGNFEEAYNYLRRAQQNNLEAVKKKYILFIDKTCYGKYLKDELAVSCYWLGKYKEGLSMLEAIVDDPDFTDHRGRLLDNVTHFNNKLNGT
jgi:glycosyltransferase involved in cell wall biosynthesis